MIACRPSSVQELLVSFVSMPVLFVFGSKFEVRFEYGLIDRVKFSDRPYI